MCKTVNEPTMYQNHRFVISYRYTEEFFIKSYKFNWLYLPSVVNLKFYCYFRFITQPIILNSRLNFEIKLLATVQCWNSLRMTRQSRYSYSKPNAHTHTKSAFSKVQIGFFRIVIIFHSRKTFCRLYFSFSFRFILFCRINN